MKTYSQLDASLTGRCSERRKVANNTYAERRVINATDETGQHPRLLRSIAIRLHNTDVATFHEDGRIVLRTGGQKSKTTKDRINEFAPVRISQSKGVWTFGYGSLLHTFADGVTLHPDGTVTGAATPDAQDADKALLKRIKAFAAKCGQALPLPLPSAGDCLYCQCSQESGGDFGGTDHLLSHLDEGYLVPSLVYRALKETGAAQATFWGAFESEQDVKHFTSFARGSVPKAVAKYLKRRLALVA